MSEVYSIPFKDNIEGAKDLRNDAFKILTDEADKCTILDYVDGLKHICHDISAGCGWWHNHKGEPLSRNFGELIALIHSEISEALEGDRKNKQDEHLPKYTSVEVELADALIRIFDLAGAMNLRLAYALVDKLVYNMNRADHKIENRMAEGGKKY